jgi:hypothetical protein
MQRRRHRTRISPLLIVCPHKKKVKPDYEHKAEAVQEPETSFKINFYFSVPDTAIMSTVKMHNADFSFLYDIHGLSRKYYDNEINILQIFTGKIKRQC